jgi:hypothetical protein
MQPHDGIYDNLVMLARICARRALDTPNRDEAAELWRMALNYRSRAAAYGDLPELGVSSLDQAA